MSNHPFHACRTGSRDQLPYGRGGDTSTLPGRSDGIAKLDSAIDRSAFPATETNQAAVLIEEEV
jgi:hypothetical protein